MKSIVNFRKAISLAMCVMFTLALFSGCSKDDGGSDVRDGYSGTYNVYEVLRYADGTSDDDRYTITITKSSVNNTDIVITNILNTGAGVQVIATVTGDNFNIPPQSVLISGMGASVTGFGRRSGNSLTFSVVATVTGLTTLTFECSANKL